MEKVKPKIKQAGRYGLAVNADVVFGQVPASGAHHQGSRFLIEGVLLAVWIGKGDAAVNGIAQIDLPLNNVIPGWGGRVFKIGHITKDDNGDKLVYKIDFRRIGRTNWIELKDELEASSFEWDGKTVEDGRYEIRVTASDARSNTTLTKLTGSRVSEPVVADNTGPVVKSMKITSSLKDNGMYRVLGIEVTD